ncbi:FxDxF family PEP-CTERM protein [Aquincola tertiaricarbonis]|uniref:FxDxF family PEP-CTERM protein n=1 Tax=Aquincola tertiaricarbonis TaxID=391953 RepID=A0ABY4SF17_AQUTE|nr:FxDxF family PEP-CTERM protein [Aquincola tertiaricarbonis]URI11578.1 FxDxF family PEP-CTERM protein [Aquincola tertiaricarbonis]
MKTTFSLLLALAAGTAQAAPSVAITEWMYKGGVGEFVEFTNLGSAPVSLVGWSFDDDSRLAGVLDLSAFGTLAAGESVLITETEADVFRADWGLAASVKVIGNYTNNLGNGDEINLFNASGALVDRLTYDKTTLVTSEVSGRPGSFTVLGANQVSGWVLSAVGDGEASWRSAAGSIGSPGRTQFASPVPEPETYALMLAGLAAVGWLARRRAA